MLLRDWDHHQPSYLHSVRDEHHRLVPERAADALVEDVLADLGVHGAQRVVQEVDVGVGVHGTRQVHPLLLAAAGGENGDSEGYTARATAVSGCCLDHRYQLEAFLCEGMVYRCPLSLMRSMRDSYDELSIVSIVDCCFILIGVVDKMNLAFFEIRWTRSHLISTPPSHLRLTPLSPISDRSPLSMRSRSA